MPKKRRNYVTALFMASAGVALLGIDRLIVHADSEITFAKTFTVITIVALFLIMGAAIWFYKMSLSD